MANSTFGLAAFAAAAVGGVALGYLGERKVVDAGRGADPVRDALQAPCRGEPVEVISPDGTRLAAQVSGPPEAPPVLLVHGMALGQEAWHYQRADLQRDHRVVTFDLRGHGDSAAGADGDYSAGALADDVVAVLQHVVPGERRVVVVGHSVGGMSLLAALRRHPVVMQDRTAGVGLMSTAASDVVGSLLRTASATGASIVQSAVVQSRPARWLRSRLEAPRAERVTDMSYLLTRHFGLTSAAAPGAVEFVDRLNRRVSAAVLGAYAQMVTTVDELDLLAGVHVPATVLVGEQDRLTPPSQAQRLADALADVEFMRLDNAGHTVMLERPDEVTAALRRLVDRSLGPGSGGRNRQR